jgi:S-adenosylmethionine:tRNA ribosyltransferase-isomerase
MKTEELNYFLPPELIAQHPAPDRTASKLLVLQRPQGTITHDTFANIATYLRPDDLLVLNNTRVLPAKFQAFRDTGGKLEGLFLAQIDEKQWKIMLKGSRKVKINEIITLKKDTAEYKAALTQKLPDGQCLIELQTDHPTTQVLDAIGFSPLPPYIKRNWDLNQEKTDRSRYQTVFAQEQGAVAAPTAGLHFTTNLLDSLAAKGISFAHVTLHVGAGTFKPVTAQNLEDHQIHSEWYSIDEKNAQIINNARAQNRRVIAVGTTAVRTLESAAQNDGTIKPSADHTKLFILPGYKFKAVDAIITNFHLPKSTLLALVAAFAGLENVLNAYNQAVENKYRFFSFGDAMLIT